MTCPRCQRAMQEIESDGAQIDICTSCRGTFLDRGEGAHFSDDAEKLEAGLLALLDRKSGHTCPRCQVVMDEGALFVANYRIEHCSGCGGMWFASKQLSRLRSVVEAGVAPARSRKKKKGAPPPSVVSKAASDRAICPRCEYPAQSTDRWRCSCGWVWDVFATQRGECPKCGKEFAEPKCPQCMQPSPRQQWMRKAAGS